MFQILTKDISAACFLVCTTCRQLSTHHTHTSRHTHPLHFIEHPPQSAPGGVVRSVIIRCDREDGRCLVTHEFRGTLNWCQNCNRAASVDKLFLHLIETNTESRSSDYEYCIMLFYNFYKNVIQDWLTKSEKLH